ncbi:MAG: PIG-L deacetylase family protein [Chryseolinea sp.]
MKKSISGRREFLASSVAGLGALSLKRASPGEQNSQPKKLKVVCVGAHPGDPEFGCGGTMARYSDAGHDVYFLYVTRGEASDPSKTHDQMAALRTKEAEVACVLLKSKPLFVGQIDGDTSLNKSSVRSFQKLLLAQSPDVVFTQWPVDGHQDHQVAGMLTLNAWTSVKRRFHLYFYEVNTGSETMAFTPTDYVDITAVRERKKQALMAHKTQDPENTYNDFFAPLEIFRGLEAGVKAAEAFVYFKPDMRSDTIGL